MSSGRDSLRSLYERPEFIEDTGSARAGVQLTMLSRAISSPSAGRLLDLGSGEGNLGRAAGDLAGLDVVAADWSTEACRVSNRGDVAVVQCAIDSGSLPFRSQSFDVVLLNEVIEHLVDPDAALDEIHRVLTPGGLLLLSTPNLGAWFNRGLLLFGVQPVFSEVSTRRIYGRPGHQVVGHLRLHTLRSLKAMITDRGFNIADTRGAPYHDVPRGLRSIDQLASLVPSLSAILLVACRRVD